MCKAGACAAASCTDKVKNGSETDVDCGGACAGCADGKQCLAAKDCGSGVCKAGACAAASCTDKVKNGAETDVDCGGGACAKCAYGEACKAAGDCTTAACGKDGLCACAGIDHCAAANNCNSGKCGAAKASCSAQAGSYPAAKDGEYWIAPATGSPYRAYCDMQLKVELCAEKQGAHQGKTREGSALAYTMTSVLLHGKGVCQLWAIRATKDNYPIDSLNAVAGQKMKTCAALGFIADDKLGSCLFGNSYSSNCGFPVKASYYRYGNLCSGCSKNNGQYKSYVLQGYMSSASVLSTMGGKTRTSCKIR